MKRSPVPFDRGDAGGLLVRTARTVLVAAALAALAAVPTASAGKAATPFKATLKGSVAYYVPDVCPPSCRTFTTMVYASGQATGIGRITIKSWHRPYDPDNHRDGHVTIVAADGDRLYGRYDYKGSDVIPVTFTGGTGRFDGASGTAVMKARVTMRFKAAPPCDKKTDAFACLDPDVPWPWSATISGTIEYAA